MATWLDLWTLTFWLKQVGFSELDPQQVIHFCRGVLPATRMQSRIPFVDGLPI